MKIAFVIDGLGFGGVQRVGVDYIKLLAAQGYEIDVYNMRPHLYGLKEEMPDTVNYIGKKFSKKLCPDVCAYATKKWKWGKYAQAVAYPILKVLLYIRRIFYKRKRYDLAIAFGGHVNEMTFVGYNFIKAKKKITWVHGGVVDFLTIADGYSALYRKINNVVVLSEAMLDIVQNGSKHLKLNAQKIYNPTFIKTRPIDRQKVDELKQAHGDFLLCLARFGVDKDHKTIIDALKVLKTEHGKVPKIVFVGSGKTQEATESYAKEVGVLEQCVFEGTREDVQNYYAAAALFVHSSPREGLGMTLVEALSFDLPIVATDSKPGVSEVLCGKYGLTCPVGDSRAMAHEIDKMLSDDDLYLHYKNLSNERAADFSPEQAIEKLNNFERTIGETHE